MDLSTFVPQPGCPPLKARRSLMVSDASGGCTATMPGRDASQQASIALLLQYLVPRWSCRARSGMFSSDQQDVHGGPSRMAEVDAHCCELTCTCPIHEDIIALPKPTNSHCKYTAQAHFLNIQHRPSTSCQSIRVSSSFNSASPQRKARPLQRTTWQAAALHLSYFMQQSTAHHSDRQAVALERTACQLQDHPALQPALGAQVLQTIKQRAYDNPTTPSQQPTIPHWMVDLHGLLGMHLENYTSWWSISFSFSSPLDSNIGTPSHCLSLSSLHPVSMSHSPLTTSYARANVIKAFSSLCGTSLPFALLIGCHHLLP